MTRSKQWQIIGWSLLAVILLGVTWPWYHGVTIRHRDHLAQVHQVGFALRLYTGDHEGKLPHRLTDMMPVYTTDRRLLEHVEFLAPDETLADLPATAVLARRVYEEDGYVSVVHSGGSAEAYRP